MSNDELRSLAFYERKEYLELKYAQSEKARRRRERAIFLGFFVITLVATLLVSGAMKFG